MAGCGYSDSDLIYLDYAATVPVAPEVRAVMAEHHDMAAAGNPHARHHRAGAQAARTVEKARGQVAAVIGARSEDILFTSGGSESNNLALQGLADHLTRQGRTHVITSAAEHQSVLAVLAYLGQKRGFDVTVLPVKSCGMIEAYAVEKALRPETGLVSVQAVNNETGTVQPLAEIAAMLAGRDILFHSDAVQAPGKILFDVQESGVDFASLSAHKIGGPQGVGALYCRTGCDKLLSPLIHGGGQERGLRSGTVPVALCAGFGVACTLLEGRAAQQKERARLQEMRELLLDRLAPLAPEIYGHSDPNWNAPGILNLRFAGIDHDALVMALPGLAFGIGAACSSAGESRKASHVIRALGGSQQAAMEAIRLSFGRYTTAEDISAAAAQIMQAVTEIKKLQEEAA